MKTTQLFFLAIFWGVALTSCSGNSSHQPAKPVKLPQQEAKRSAVDSAVDSGADSEVDSSVKFFTVGKERYVAFDSLNMRIPDSIDISAANLYGGIYELQSSSMSRHKFLVTKRTVLVTTFADLGRGYEAYLYAFDRKRKRFVRDREFGRSYLYSSAGIFVVDRARIFSFDKSAVFEAKHAWIIPVSVDEINGAYFHNDKIIYKIGDQVSNDTTGVVAFVKSADSAKSSIVRPLPEGWWKGDLSHY